MGGGQGLTLPIGQPPILSGEIRKVCWFGGNPFASLREHTKTHRGISKQERVGAVGVCAGGSQHTHGA